MEGMGFRQSLALNLTPLCLRLSLGVTFIWAGSAKLFYDHPFQGESAAVLANLGIPLGGPGVAGAPAVPSPAPGRRGETPATAEPPAEKPSDAPAGPDGGSPAPAAPPPAAAVYRASAPSAPGPFTGEDFPEARPAKRLYLLTVVLHRAAQPDANGRVAWPVPLASPRALKLLPWAVAVAELLGGALVLVGFGARLWSLVLAGIMGTAIWLTAIHPALESGSVFLGFLPPPRLDDPAQWATAWQGLLFQFVLGMAAMGVFFSGAGALSLDRAMFMPRGAAPPAKASKPAAAA